MEEEIIYENLEQLPIIFRNYLLSFLSVLKIKFGNSLLSIVVFGSVARGKWSNNSDIDLLLIFSENYLDKRKLNEILTDIKIKFYEKNNIKNKDGINLYIPIQEITLLYKDLNNFRTLYYDIAMDGVILFDKNDTAQKFITNIKKRIKENNVKRIYISDNNFYWKRGKIKFGEIIEL
jgi:predicted nucleotidyltransferase